MTDTVPGAWSLKLILGFFLLFGVFLSLVASGQRGGETFGDNLWLSVPMSLGILCAVSSFLTGCFSIVRRKERSVFVYFSAAIGFFVLLFILGEFLFPH